MNAHPFWLYVLASTQILKLILFGFLRPDLLRWICRNRCFDCTVMSDSKRSEFGSRNQKAIKSAGKDIRAVLERHHALKHACRYFRSSWVFICYIFLARFRKVTSLISVSFSYSQCNWFYLIFKLLEWLFYHKYVSQTTLNHLNQVWNLYSNCFGWKSFLQSNSPEILDFCETNSEDSVNFSNFTVNGCFCVNQKDFVTHTHVTPVNVEEGRPFTRN